jgi:large subunit ribosomal protein L3
MATMIQGMIGRKVGMTQMFEDNGRVRPVTVLEAGPCVIIQRKTQEKDGYQAVQMGLVDAKSAQKANKAMQGHHKAADVPPTRMRREFLVDDESEAKPGDTVLVDIFDGVAQVDVIGTSKGKGFQGVIKRHGFGGGKASHGSMHHRAPGSIGMAAYPGKVMKGMRGPGRMGGTRITAKNLKVIRVDVEKNLLLVEGSVPGHNGSALVIRCSQSQPKSEA